MPSNPHASDIPEEARTLAEPDALAELRDDPVLANVRTFESFPVLGSCVLFARLGGGAQGAVYRAWHRELNIQVAVKARLASAGIAADRFVLEAGQGAGLTHQNLIGALEVKEADGLQYMILDYVDGEDVAARMKRKRRMEPREALTILREAAAGLAFAHRKGVLHRDIKPANIMISKDGEVKIADLGLAKAAEATDLSLTMAGSGMGTPMFMPPEQFVEAKSVGPAADVYSLAITGWLMLAGRNPFKGSSPYEIKDLVCGTGVANLQNVVPGIPPSIADLLARGTERKASNRIPDGAHFLTEVERELYAVGGPMDLADPHAGAFLHQGVLPPSAEVITRLMEHENLARQGTRKEHATILSGPRDESPVVPPRDGPAEAKKKSPAAAIVLLLLVAGGGVGWWFTMGPGAEPDSPDPKVDPKAAPHVEPNVHPTQVVPPGGTKPQPETDPSQPIAVDHAALASAAFGDSEWSTMFQEMRLHVEASSVASPDLKDWLNERTSGFRELGAWKQTRDRLDEAGQEALTALASNSRSSTPLVCLTAAELSVVYDGLRYRVVEEPGNYEVFLRKALLGDRPIKAEAKFLLGAAHLHDFLVESTGAKIPKKEVTDKAYDRLKGADEDGHDSAGAWLGLLYLRIRELEQAGGGQESVPRSWVIGESTLVEIVKKGAARGSKEAHYMLATMYDLKIAPVDAPDDNDGTERRRLSNKHYGSAATLGHPVAIGILMERGENLRTAVNDNLKMLESFLSQPNPETRSFVERLLALAVLTEQPGKDLANYSREDAMGVLFERANKPIPPTAPDRAWLDRTLWLLWADEDPVFPPGVKARWFEEACASPWNGPYRPLAMDLLLTGEGGFGTSALLIMNSGSISDREFPSAEVLRNTIGSAVDAYNGAYPPIIQKLLAQR